MQNCEGEFARLDADEGRERPGGIGEYEASFCAIRVAESAIDYQRTDEDDDTDRSDSDWGLRTGPNNM